MPSNERMDGRRCGLWAEPLRSLPAGREQRAHMFVDAAHAEEPDENGLATLHLAGYVRGKLIGSTRSGTHGCCSGARLQHSRLLAALLQVCTYTCDSHMGLAAAQRSAWSSVSTAECRLVRSAAVVCLFVRIGCR